MPASRLTADLLVVGGGVAGLSLAAAVAQASAGRARVLLVEAEAHLASHSSARSAARFHYALGNPQVRALSRASRAAWLAPAEKPGDPPLSHIAPILLFAAAGEEAQLAAAERAMAGYGAIERLDEAGVRRLCPLLAPGFWAQGGGLVDRGALALDTSAYLARLSRTLRRLGGTIETSARLARGERRGGAWEVTLEDGRVASAPVLVNAAGAWADRVAQACGAQPIGLVPRRRTVILVDPPAGTDLAALPFCKAIDDRLYFGPESGRLLVSPMDEEPCEPHDAQADELAVAHAADRFERATGQRVARVVHRWAGLRSFVADGSPVVGERAGEDGFFWFAGQGGAGFQTAPALAAIAARKLVGSLGVEPLTGASPGLAVPDAHDLRPDRPGL